MDSVPQDNVTDAMIRGQYQFAEQLFYNSARLNGFDHNRALDRAMALYRLWLKEGYTALPDWTKDHILRVCEGQFSSGCSSEYM